MRLRTLVEKRKNINIWIYNSGNSALFSSRLGPYICVLLVLSGCRFSPEFLREDQLQSVQFKSGVIVEAPTDYCFDRQLIKDRVQAGFAVIIPCDEITGTLNPGLFTLTIVAVSGEKVSAGDLNGFDFTQDINEMKIMPQVQFRRLENLGETRISGMKNEAWQLIAKRNSYISVLTLHMPEFVNIETNTAKTRLLALLENINNPGSKKDTNHNVTKPRVRPYQS